MPFPIEIKYIQEAEHELDLIFPESFKIKMLNENGGELISEDEDWQMFPFFDKSDKKRISRTCNHIVLETQNAKLWDSYPDNGVAIATNGYGDLLLLLPIESDNNLLGESIFMWFHDTGEIEKIANSIIELTV